MNKSYKPNNYTTVSPYLIVNGAGGTIDFLKRVFGAVELRRFPDAAGKIMHAEVRLDDTVVMLADGAEGWPPVPSHVHIYDGVDHQDRETVSGLYFYRLSAGAFRETKKLILLR